ncbi:DNA gyrase subunit A [Microgenomates group bacterium RBG_19FT_COMBO_39_10]|nr:MAG: DNA gyrase subunit A [Microgenomates group bacterium RBG_19FT_COMBO_39_10]
MASKIGKIQPVEITDEMQKSYLDYAMSVIVSRALPDIRDGLKPVHRRILFAMSDMGLSHTAKHTKSAKIVGETMGKYHPHGDMAIYDSLVRLAQDFSMRYPLIDGQGNFGSVDGDPPAAMRYTEARMSKISVEMLTDIEKNTVDYVDNFDGSLQEPVFLPAKVPNLLLMGADGIAVGMATKIPPHNLNEVVDGLLFLIDKGKVILPESQKTTKEKETFEIKKIQLEVPEGIKKNEKIPALQSSFESEVTIEELMKNIKGPDFPTGALVFDKDQILQAYSTGKGKILMRAEAEIEETRGGKFQIIVSQIPFQVNKSQLVAKIAQLVKEKRVKGVSTLRDESDRQGMRIVIELKKSAKPKVVLNSLYKHTLMQTTYPVNMVALVDGVPQTLTLKQILTEFVKHRQQITTRRSIFELEAAKSRAHILEGLKIALDNLDAVIATIKKSRTVENARINLMKKFKLTEIQANAILEMQLRRLAALERKKIEDEYKEIGKLIAYLTNILTHPEKIITIIKKELNEVKRKYGDPRRTKIYRQEVESFSEEDLIAKEKCLITVTKTGYIKRLPVITYRSQRRGGKGVTGMTTKEADEISYFMTGETHDQVLFFTNKGRVYAIRAWEIPEGLRTAKGQAVINLINIEQGEDVQSVLNLPSSSTKNKYRYLIMATKKGTVKKTSLRNFKKIRSSGLIAIKLNRGDELCWVKPTTGKDQVLLVTRKGKSIRFNEADARPMGRDTIGVRGILLKEDDQVVAMEVFPAKAKKPKDRRLKHFRDVLVVMEKGLGKRTNIRYHPIQKRGGVGVKAANVTEKTGKIVSYQLVTQKDKQVILSSKRGQVIKLPLKNIPQLGRSTQGVILMRFSKPGDSVAAMTCLKK